MSLRFLDFTTNLNVFKSTTMDSEVNQFLLDLYQPLIGRIFEAMYNGEFKMPQTDNERSILVVNPQNPFAAELHRISSDVLARNNGQRFWKGITGPEDSPNYVNYWLWVEPGISVSLEEGYSMYNFKISGCTPFPCAAGSFTHGVSIQVAQEVEEE